LTAGLATGLMNAADAFEGGARTNKANPTEFRRQMNTFRTQSSRLAIQFAETFLAFEKSNPASIPIAFGYPSGNAMPVVELAKVAEGWLCRWMSNAWRPWERGVADNCTAVGNREHGGPNRFGTNVTVPKETFVLGMATKLYELSKLFSPTKMREPERLKLFLSEAHDAVKALPQTDETKKLQEKIERAKPSKRPVEVTDPVSQGALGSCRTR
jgi:hypothetical protein